MNAVDQALIAEAWIRYHNAGDSADERHGDFWAYEQLCHLIETDPEAAWQVILTIFNRDSSDLIIANLAAGPMEDLLGSYGAQLIERVEELGKTDALFRKLVESIWQNSIPNDIWLRLKALSA